MKARRYAELEVGHYWIVDPDRQRVECHRLESGGFRLVVEAEGSASLIHPIRDGLVIDLAALWR